MTERFSLDSNVLIYAVDHTDVGRHHRAAEIVQAAATGNCPLAVQALGEFFHVVTRKGILVRSVAAQRVDEMRTIFETIGADSGVLGTAIEAAQSARLSIWDAMLVATVEQAGCTLLLSEDMHDGGRFGGVTIVNPFKGRALPKRAAEALGLR